MASTDATDTDAFDRTTAKGAEDGLFRDCMTSIRSAHIRANKMRISLTLAGLFTDRKIYREVLTLFYVVTKELELKLASLQEEAISKKLLSLGYSFTQGYERDLRVLYGATWKEDVAALIDSNDALKAYKQQIQSFTTAEEVAGGVFCLWGALVIGGGAAAMPRAKALCGPEGIHVFESVTGPGREQRKADFVQTWDSLAEKDSPSYSKIVKHAQECMQGNNDLMSSVQRSPWWLNYVLVAVLSIALYYLYPFLSKISK